MKIIPSRRRPAGYVSLLVVLSTGTLLTLLTIAAYKRAVDAHSIQTKAQMRVDYAEKEESILRSVLTLTPNRAIHAMQGGSNTNTAARTPMSWQQIFTDSLDLANARTSISADMRDEINLPNLQVSNTGDSALADPAAIFRAIAPSVGFVASGLSQNLGAGYPASLSCDDAVTSANDALYPIISDQKYDPNAPAGYGPQFANRSKFRVLQYPRINFGYSTPGQDFVAKRNWWAFSMNVAANDSALTRLATNRRDFVLSIYEVPSQLAISAASFMSLGRFASGDEWQNVTIDGGMFVGTAQVDGGGDIYQRSTLASRRAMTLANGTAIGGETFAADPFAAGNRERHQVDPSRILPVSLASESSRATFIPISRGREDDAGQAVYPFFDRFAAPREGTETDVLSSTRWNEYSRGSMQCAMRLTVTEVVSANNQKPTMLEFEYLPVTGNRLMMQVPLNDAVLTSLPPGFVPIATQNQSFNLNTLAGGVPVDVAYGINNGPGKTGFTIRRGLSGPITFNNATFGNPIVGEGKRGYWCPQAPFEIKPTASGQTCVAVYPERFPNFLSRIGAGNTARNHSLVVNVDYTRIGATAPQRPQIDPCRETDYGLILQECADLRGFTKGFSLVTNLRIYFGDDFNVVPTTPPAGYTPAVTATNPTGRFMPPCSLFAPEKRYGVDLNPFGVSLRGQIGSLATGDKVEATDTLREVRPLDSRTMSGTAIAADRIQVNLSQLRHPAELPPVTMMNWLVVLEERRTELDELPPTP